MNTASRQLPDDQWQAIRRQVFERDGYRCRACNADLSAGGATADHILPLSGGGKAFALENLQTLCTPCHRAKTKRENVLKSRGVFRGWQRRREADDLPHPSPPTSANVDGGGGTNRG